MVGLCAGVLYALSMVLIWPITQSMVSRSTINLPYTVIYPCKGTSHATMVNEATIDFKAWLHSDFVPFEASLSTAPVDGSGAEVPVGTMKWPKMSLAPGHSSVGFTTSIELIDQDLFSSQFLDPMFAEGKKMKLTLDVRGLRLNELGFFPCPGLHMRKVLVCHAKSEVTTLPADEQIEAGICSPTTMPETPSEEADSLAQRTDFVWKQAKGYAMECIAEESSQSTVAV
jgi:hypothetical protein